VVAVVALSDNLYIVMFGVAMGIITMRFAAGIFTWMIAREPILKPAAYIVVFNIGAELLIHEWAGIEFSAPIKFMISAGTLIFAVIYARVKVFHIFQPIFIWIGQGMANANELLDWALKPIWLLFKIFFRAIYLVTHPIVSLLILKSETITDVVGASDLQRDCVEGKKEKEHRESSF